MDAVEKALKKQLICAIAFSLMFAAGIPMIIFGAVRSAWALMAAGIAFAAAGFYGTPIVWINYGDKVAQRRVVYAVTKEHLLTVQDVAAQLSKTEKDVRNLLSVCFNKGYLSGYVRQGDNIALNEAKAPEERKHAAECRFCGAKFAYTGDVAICPYCGAADERIS
ncbi:MAG: hypothetical protein SPH68_04190 [Candidatus Borkfalkiaceae bacterium]|nr:hypothetical protein [Clostridia bacterium]MDY6223339.1 hypothetical protein [Christensenellaceae bacterium]